MDLNFSKKTRKIVASLLAVAILLGVLPVSGLTGNSSGAESSSSENSTKTIYVNSTKQPILFDSVGNFKEIIPKVKKNIYSTEAENGDKIALFTDIGNGNSVVFYKTTEWTPSAYMWKEDSSENPDKNAAWPGEAMKNTAILTVACTIMFMGQLKDLTKLSLMTATIKMVIRPIIKI